MELLLLLMSVHFLVVLVYDSLPAIIEVMSYICMYMKIIMKFL